MNGRAYALAALREAAPRIALGVVAIGVIVLLVWLAIR